MASQPLITEHNPRRCSTCVVVQELVALAEQYPDDLTYPWLMAAKNAALGGSLG